MLERLVRHDRTEVGAADSYVDHISNPFARVTFPFAAAYTTAELRHPVQHMVNFGYDIGSIYNDGFIFRSTQGYVQHGPLLGGVDLFPAKHRVDSCPQARFCGQLEQELEGFVSDAIFGIVEI